MTSTGDDVSGMNVLERLSELPGAEALLAAARAHEGEVELVGGAVRDILLGRSPRELDVVVEGDVRAFAEDLASRVSGSRSVASAAPPARGGRRRDGGSGKHDAPCARAGHRPNGSFGKRK